MLLKYRKDTFGVFTDYLAIPEDELARYVGPLNPYNPWEQITFRFAIPIIEELQPYFNHRHENEYRLRVPYHFYYVEGGHIVIVYQNQLFFFHQNITHYQIGDHPWQPIENMRLYQLCRFIPERNIFAAIGGIHTQLQATSEEEIEELGLQLITL